jgi:hypothetical protein
MLAARMRAYVHEGEPLATVLPVPADREAVLNRLAATVLLGNTRTMQQHPPA